MSLPTRISLSPSGADAGGLIRSSRNIPNSIEWQRGVRFSTSQCLAPQRVGPCPVEPITPNVAARPSPEQDFEPVIIRQGVDCSTLGGFDIRRLAEESVEVTREFALGQELLDGLGTENPSLSEAPVIAAAVDVPTALACLEAAAAIGLSGRLAYIHVPPQLSVFLPRHVFSEDGVWRTIAGSVIVVSPGYSGQSMFATGEVWTAVGYREVSQQTDRSINTDTAWADELGLAVFDPCFSAQVETTVEACVAPTSP